HRSSRCSRFPTVQTIGRNLPTIRKNSHLSISQQLHFADYAIAALELAFSAAATTNSISPHSQRICVFHRFSRRVQRVGHVSMNTVDAVQSGTSTKAAGDRFVISELLPDAKIGAPNRQVVHCPLACGWNKCSGPGHRSEYGVDDSLRGFDVPARN